MGYMSRVLVASSEEIDECWETAFDGPLDEFDVANIFSQETLASLLVVVIRPKKLTAKQLLKKVEIISVYDPAVGLVRVPQEVVDALPELETKRLFSLAESWKEEDQFLYDAGEGVTAEHLEIILRAMRKASKKAKRSGKEVYICSIP